MIPPRMEYAAPDSVADAVSVLADAGEDAKVLAGGQSLLPVLRLRMAYPSMLVDLRRIPELRGVRDDGTSIVVGGMTRHADVIDDPLVRRHAALLAAATATVADPQVRHRGTFGGALAHGDPAGDLPAVAVALDAEMVVEGPAGRRTIPASAFFLDYLQTALDPGEILCEVRIPKLDDGWSVHYEKFNRTAQAWAVVGVAAAVQRSNGTITAARVGLTNMGTTPVRAYGVEEALAGRPADAATVAEAATRAGEGTNPPSDLGGQADYRSHLATVLTRRAVSRAAHIG